MMFFLNDLKWLLVTQVSFIVTNDQLSVSLFSSARLVVPPSTQPHGLFSLVSVHLAQGNMTGALALFRDILTSALSTSSSFSSLAGCEQCRSSLPLLRCLQFYPFLYNLSQRQPCSGEPLRSSRTWLSLFQSPPRLLKLHPYRSTTRSLDTSF